MKHKKPAGVSRRALRKLGNFLCLEGVLQAHLQIARIRFVYNPAHKARHRQAAGCLCAATSGGPISRAAAAVAAAPSCANRQAPVSCPVLRRASRTLIRNPVLTHPAGARSPSPVDHRHGCVPSIRTGRPCPFAVRQWRPPSNCGPRRRAAPASRFPASIPCWPARF
jgi:hypothetical protein